MISVESKLYVKPFSFDLRTQSVSVMTVEVDFITKKSKNYSSQLEWII